MDEELLGFKKLCQQAIFYTHAYSPSTYSPSVLASIFTSKYPFEHSLKGPGQYLSESFDTIAERLVSLNYATSFFSSGLPLSKKTGLDQGFEHFNELAEKNQVNTSSDLVLNKFFDWHVINKNKNYFSLLHLSDTFYPELSSINNEGYKHGKGRSNQIKNLSETIFNLYNYLSKNNILDETTLIFFGLNGVSNKANQIKLTNFYSENIRVPVLIKPSQKKRDLAMNWKIDNNISLIDIGFFLEKTLLNKNIEQSKFVVDISESTIKPVAGWDNKRPIYTYLELLTKNNSMRHLAVRKKNYLYRFFKDKIFSYNSLIDRTENIESIVDSEAVQAEHLLKMKVDYQPSSKEIDEAIKSKYVVLSDFVNTFWYDKSEINYWPLEFIYQHAENDVDFKNYFIYWAAINRKINLLQEDVFNQSKNDFMYLYNKTLDNEDAIEAKSSCLVHFIEKNKDEFQKMCNDSLSKNLWKYQVADKNKEKNKLAVIIIKKINQIYFANEINIKNVAKGYVYNGLYFSELETHWVFKLNFIPRYNKIFFKYLQ